MVKHFLSYTFQRDCIAAPPYVKMFHYDKIVGFPFLLTS